MRHAPTPIALKARRFAAGILSAACVFLLVAGCLPPRDAGHSEGQLAVHFIDVGQGASQLLIGPTGKTMLIDAGNNSMEKRIVQYIRDRHITRIDLLIGTHPDADHIGGLDAVIDHFDIGKVYMPRVQANTQTFEDVLSAVGNKGLKVSTAKAGIALTWEDTVRAEMIAPLNTYSDTNDMSAVIRLTFGKISFLLTGDAEWKSEKDLLAAGIDLKSNVLLVGHHGSTSSTSQAFLDAVDPQFAVIQTGKNNYGHPAPEVLNRLKNVELYRNDLQGNIIFTTDGRKISVLTDGRNVPRTAERVPAKPNAYYENCTDARAAGDAPLYANDPGYSRRLDRDGDGIACE